MWMVRRCCRVRCSHERCVHERNDRNPWLAAFRDADVGSVQECRHDGLIYY